MSLSKIYQPPSGRPLNRGHNLSQGLIGCWPMNENSGSILSDMAGAHRGTLLGTFPCWYSGYKNGSAVKFNATDNYATSTLASTAFMTCSFWVRLATAPISTDNIGILFWDGTTVANFLSFLITGTAPSVGIFKSNVGNFLVTNTVASVKDGNWHHLAFTLNKASAASSHIYVDGVELVYNTTTNQSFTQDTGFNINHFAVTGTSRFSPSIMCGLMMWNRQLSKTEVQQLYSQPYCMFR